MCSPGYRIKAGGTCQDPKCEPCGLNEYVDDYNRMTICSRQRYCDPNKNFVYRQDETTLHMYHMYSCHGCSSAPVQEIHDQTMRQLYASNLHEELPLCHNAGVFVSHCIPCATPGEEDSTAVLCRDGARPRYLNGKPDWPADYEPTLILYSPNKELECVCKAGFHCSSEECITCIPQDESTTPHAGLHEPADSRGETYSNSDCDPGPGGERRCRALYGADRLLLSYCESTISVYTFPLGYSVTSQGEAIGLSAWTDAGDRTSSRCPPESNFTKPSGASKAASSIRERPRASPSKESQGSRIRSPDTPECRRPRWRHGLVEVTFSKTDAVERSVERSVALSEKVSVSSSSYQCQVGNAMVSSYEPSSALRQAMEELNADPEGRIEEFLDTWGYGFVSEVEVGGYYSSFEVFSTCNKDAEESLDDAAERCRETGANFKVEGFGAGASAGGSTARCDTRGLSDSERKTLASISRESRHVQIGGDNLGGEVDWESTLKMNPYPLRIRVTPIFNVKGFSPRAVELLKLRAEKARLYPDEFLAEGAPNIVTKCC
ncbi:hypothetical protein Q5P01_000164 [Channa striata]|uniref:MACPF domain-containing protein n=1 Tax=Channa striata TaxID=64152 RepID=A0AA88LFC4_CHASR|nr:hypothetical protein Q5P01_000164 [Channa striata]